jgi:hypothetical protein|tara:strand:+ start:441 stop:632 length:192 start_codon:yes stop_codon:yes gene_type:complete
VEISGGVFVTPGVFENSANGVKTEPAQALRHDIYGNFRGLIEHRMIQAELPQPLRRTNTAEKP